MLSNAQSQRQNDASWLKAIQTRYGAHLIDGKKASAPQISKRHRSHSKAFYTGQRG